MKPWYQSKTVIVGVAIGLLSALNLSRDYVTDPDTLSLIAGVIGAVMVYLRAITGSPVGTTGK
jgi:CBS-domain-containing membrane protein